MVTLKKVPDGPTLRIPVYFCNEPYPVGTVIDGPVKTRAHGVTEGKFEVVAVEPDKWSDVRRYWM